MNECAYIGAMLGVCDHLLRINSITMRCISVKLMRIRSYFYLKYNCYCRLSW